MLNTTDESRNFFVGFYQWDWIKVSYLIFQFLLTLFGPAFMCSISWYEKYIADQKYW
jgi:hypothetical protein